MYAGLPLHRALRREGKAAFLANLTFTNLGGTDARRLAPRWPSSTRTSGEPDYLPERALARFLEEERGETDVVVYALDKTGVEPARHAYEALARHLDVDAIVLVHGGTDILMRGDEAGLGTSALLPSMPEVSTYLEESEVMRARGACHWTTRKLAHVARAGSTSLGSR